MNVLVAMLVLVGADDGAAFAIRRFPRYGAAGGLARVHVEREIARRAGGGVAVVELHGKDAFDPDFGGASGFQPMSYSRWAGGCQGLAVAVEDGHGRLVMRSLAGVLWSCLLPRLRLGSSIVLPLQPLRPSLRI